MLALQKPWGPIPHCDNSITPLKSMVMCNSGPRAKVLGVNTTLKELGGTPSQSDCLRLSADTGRRHCVAYTTLTFPGFSSQPQGLETDISQWKLRVSHNHKPQWAEPLDTGLQCLCLNLAWVSPHLCWLPSVPMSNPLLSQSWALPSPPIHPRSGNVAQYQTAKTLWSQPPHPTSYSHLSQPIAPLLVQL